jgi:hypothetical protein
VFKFTKDKEGTVYAKTDDNEMLIDDFFSIHQMSEFKKARKYDTQNLVFSDQSQEFYEADFADIGNELENTDQSSSGVDEKVKQFS